MKKTITTFKNACEEGRRLTMLTAYDYSTARIIDSCDMDGILVGDSLGMVFLGYNDTLSVTMEDMIHHSRAVSRGVEKALIVCDMPFMSYHTSTKDAVRNAGRLVQEGGAEAVKIEGGSNISKHAKVFRNVGAIMKEGINAYVKEVRELTFPSEEHTFKMTIKNKE